MTTSLTKGAKKPEQSPVADCVSKSVKRYLSDLNGEKPCGMYDMVLKEMEKPLLEAVMHHAKSNQTRAAQMLGINRNTLRKKLKTYGLE